MSGVPTVQGVRAFRTKLQRLREVVRDRASNEAERYRIEQTRAALAEEEPKLRRDLVAMMTTMDAVTTKGNFGYEARTLAFLLEMDEQALAEVRPPQALTPDQARERDGLPPDR